MKSNNTLQVPQTVEAYLLTTSNFAKQHPAHAELSRIYNLSIEALSSITEIIRERKVNRTIGELKVRSEAKKFEVVEFVNAPVLGEVLQ